MIATTSYLKNRYIRVLGPVVLSAFSILITCLLLQPLLVWLNPSYTLLANRGVGKITLSIIVIAHVLLLATTSSQQFLSRIYQASFTWLHQPTTWLPPFFAYFSLFASLHTIILTLLCATGYASCTLPNTPLTSGVIWSCTWGFLVTFLLAWSEEVIFRAAVFNLLRTELAPTASILLSALIFTAAHDLTNPLRLTTIHWPLGLGLFLLGILLAQLYQMSNHLYVSMGAHAGLVFVKVVLRRIPLIAYSTALPWWLAVDLRQAPIIHLLFALGIIVLWIYNRSNKIVV